MSAEKYLMKLQQERTDYKYSSQVRTIAKSLMQLSQGIYTEPERFVYELLQNAVDAFTDTGKDTLEILIRVDKDKFMFMHNGKPFNEKDVEGICDVGNGTKDNDSKKIGYKGIGFKSVFMPSVNQVRIISGDFCFEFNKDKALSLMPKYPDDETPLTRDDVPWQVIPINSPSFRDTFKSENFNVITVVYTPEVQKIASKIEQLFTDLQFLLFLRSHNVNIRFVREGKQVFSVAKRMEKASVSIFPMVTLLKNNTKISSWIFYSKEVLVPMGVKAALEHDFNTPKKLRGAHSVEISFAVQVENGKVVPVKSSSVFTFLPTSYRGLKEPFLINSNFITDAGRQQLHQESEWNNMVFSKIPELYLEFVAGFSSSYVNYTDVLPTISTDDDKLGGVYMKSLEDAFGKIAFVPNRENKSLLKVGDVIVDKTGISKGVISMDRFLSYVNDIWGKHFSPSNFVDDLKIAEYANNKVTVFDNEKLSRLLSQSDVLAEISVQDDIKLVKFLFEYSQRLRNLSQQQNQLFRESLQLSPFLLDEKHERKQPGDIVFPSSFKVKNGATSNVPMMDNVLFEAIKKDDKLINWLRELGVTDLSDLSFVEYLLNHQDYVNKGNALSVGRFLFDIWHQVNFLENNSFAKKIGDLPFLSKDGELRPISTLYLGNKYKPEDDIESIYPNKELYVSDEYPTTTMFDDWAFFLKKCGAGHRIGISETIIAESASLFPFLRDVANSFREYKHNYVGYCGFKNPIINIKYRLNYFSFVNYRKPNRMLDKYVFSKVLSQDRQKFGSVDKVFGDISYWSTSRGVAPVEKPMADFVPYSFKSQYNSYMEYVIANEQRFPTTKGTFERPSEVFINQPSIIELGGKYLPVLDIDSTIHESWRNLLPFKKDVSLKDLLTVLEKLSQDQNAEKEEIKDRVSKIYREIIDRNMQESIVIKEWTKTHKILSQSGTFIPANELSYITVDGFNGNDHKVYCEKVGSSNREKLIQLMRTLGVKVIIHDDIRINFKSSVENTELKDLLMQKVQYIAVLRNGLSNDFVKTKSELTEKIRSSKFFKCESIDLTYGTGNDTISKSTFAQNECFYYTGIFTPARVEPLLSPLCNFLNIKTMYESELMVILITPNHKELAEFLKDKGYETSHLIAPANGSIVPISISATSGNLSTTFGVLTDQDVLEKGSVGRNAQMEINKEARKKVKSYLAERKYDVSAWDPETSLPDIVNVIKDPDGNPINLVVRSAKQKMIHLSASSFETLMSRPNNLLIVENNRGVHCVSFTELFGNNNNVNLIFDALYTPREYFQALGVIFKYVKGTEFVVKDPNYSACDEIQEFGLEIKNSGTILISNTDNI